MAMQLTPAKRSFLTFISGGYQVIFACTFTAEDVASGEDDGDDEDPDMKFIRVNLLSYEETMLGSVRPWFCGRKLAKLFKGITTRAQEDLVVQAFWDIDNLDISVGQAFDESCVTFDEFKTFVGESNWTKEHRSLMNAFTLHQIRSHAEFMAF
jgi:hypothetical protein